MKNARFPVLVLALTISTLGSPAQAWSPLQYDTEKEVGLPDHNLLRDVINRFKRDTSGGTMADPGAAAPDGGSKEESAGNGGADNAAPSKPEAQQAQSAIEKDASGGPDLQDSLPGGGIENGANTPQLKQSLSDDDSDRPAEPLRAKTGSKPPGSMPTEGISDPQYFMDRAHSFALSGDFQSALNYVNKALDLKPNLWAAWYEKGLIYQLAGYDGPAARRYLGLIERCPDMVQAHVALGSLYRKHANYDLAEKEFKKAIELNFYYFPAHYNFANLLMEQKNYEQALKQYKVCLKLKPDNAMVHNNLGVIYQHRNYLDEAAEEFEAASHLDPANKLFVENLESVRASISRKAPKAVTM